jgi:hypothetical protein
MKKSYLIAVVVGVVLLVLLAAGYWYLQPKKNEPVPAAETPKEEVLPSVSTNPLDNKPSVNPIDQTNPFEKVKTNPFE